MAGNVKVGGNVIATHTGVEGAGTVTLSNVTASALKMSSSGNTITDSAGNAVLSESSGTVNINKGTVGSSVVFPAGHIIETKQYLYRAAISFNHNGGNYTMISGFEVATNALMANVKFLISYDVSAGIASTNDHGISASIFKDSDSTPLSGYTNTSQPSNQKPSHGHSPGYINSASGSDPKSRMWLMRGSFLYTSTISVGASITFKIGVFQHDPDSQSAYINVSAQDENSLYQPRSVSQLTVQQIAV